MGIQLSMNWEGRDAKDFSRVFDAAAMMTTFRPLLHAIGKEVVAPSVDANFEAGGRPPWAPLAESTVRSKSAAGYSQPGKILVATGALRKAAANYQRYNVSDDTLKAWPWRKTYWAYHQRGDGLPQRVIMMLQTADRTKINTLFANYIRTSMVFDPSKPGARQFTGGRRF